MASTTPDLTALNWTKVMCGSDASMDQAMQKTDWPALCRLASELRDGVPCEPLDYATNGYNNMARLLRFADGVLWVARIAMRRSAPALARLRGEVDTMHWIRAQSPGLPVPTVFASAVDEHNAVGVPYVLMSFAPGNTAMDACGGFDVHRGVIPVAQRPRFYRAVAACHVKMTALRLPQIGTVRRTPDGAFEAGPIPGIGGPFDTASAFFAAWADHARFPRQHDEVVKIMGGAPETEQVVRSVAAFPDRFRAVAPRLARRVRWDGRCHDRGPFPLCHSDFLHSNIIVAGDDDFDVLAVIDWEGACTLPLELVHFPRFLDDMPRRFGPAKDLDPDDGLPVDADDRQRWLERREYVQTVAALEVQQAQEQAQAQAQEQEQRKGQGVCRSVDRTLSECLFDEAAQGLAYAMRSFDDGKLGFYDQVLDDLEEGLPPDGAVEGCSEEDLERTENGEKGPHKDGP